MFLYNSTYSYTQTTTDPVMTLFFLFFIGFLCYIIYMLYRKAKIWDNDSNSPVLTVDATVVTKRTYVANSLSKAVDNNAYRANAYYVTFEFTDGERKELWVKDTEYGLLVEGDKGQLTYQGGRFNKFERIK